jgi:cytochrome oxidase Cu insertion factor (SCO1/SenC/PrrC family)
LLAILLLVSPAFGQGMTAGIMSPPANVRPQYLQNVGIEQHLDAQVPADLAFVDDAGRAVKLGDYFGKRPLILNLVYYNCTMLCGEALAGLTGAMKMVKFNVGDEFDVVTVSFNPQETPEVAAAKKQDYLKRYGRTGAASGWHFLTGPAESINALTKAVGFQYQYDPKSDQYAHATAIMVLTLFLRCRLSAERPAHGLSRSFAGQNRQRRRSGAALLLPLQPRDGKIWRHRKQHAETRRGTHNTIIRRLAVHSLPARQGRCAQDFSSSDIDSGETDSYETDSNQVCSITFHYGPIGPRPRRATLMPCSSS